jgi:hypothetical protein
LLKSITCAETIGILARETTVKVVTIAKVPFQEDGEGLEVGRFARANENTRVNAWQPLILAFRGMVFLCK